MASVDSVEKPNLSGKPRGVVLVCVKLGQSEGSVNPVILENIWSVLNLDYLVRV